MVGYTDNGGSVSVRSEGGGSNATIQIDSPAINKHKKVRYYGD